MLPKNMISKNLPKNAILRPKYFYDRPSWVYLNRWENIETSMESLNQAEFGRL